MVKIHSGVFYILIKNRIFVKRNKMKILIDVEEAQIDFMLDLLSKFDFVSINTENVELANEEKDFIETRMAHHLANKDKAIRWEDLKQELEQTL